VQAGGEGGGENKKRKARLIFADGDF
jgi:hypothetical protein